MIALVRPAASALACISLTLCAAASGVHYVDATGNGHFTDVQSAIDAAADGDLILVRSGEYAGFVLDGRRLYVVADAGADARVKGTVVVRNTPPSSFVLLADLAIEGTSIYPTSRPGLELLDNGGHVRVQDCALKGGAGYPNTSGGHGGEGASVKNCLRAALVRCAITGGVGYGSAVGVGIGGNGGLGLVEQGSALALYECAMQGGMGGDADLFPGCVSGDGGDGCHVIDWGILASGCSFRGGSGGGESGQPGDGGDGLVVLAGQAQLVDCTYTGGAGGHGFGGTTTGQPGQPQSGGGVFNFHPGSARSLEASTLAAESSSVELQIAGDPGDQVWLLSSAAPGFQFMPSVAGILLLLPQPMLFAARPVSVLPQSGTATIVLPTSALTGGAATGQRFAQGLLLGTDGWRLSSPVLFVVLDCSSLGPDCNSNGSNDSCDVLSNTSQDCDKNGVPDECAPDCNSNGIPDPCDIINGTSPDLNGNGIPDECELQTTWYVDVSAPPGGNGSAGAPFHNLREALAISLPGNTVIVADGVYTGPENGYLDLDGKDIIVKSANGPAACIIDCELSQRAFYIRKHETNAARIEGFTIRNGTGHLGGGIYLGDGSYATISNCIFEDCYASGHGGAIASYQNAHTLPPGPLIIENCLFLRCRASNNGGAVYSEAWFSQEALLVRNCTFDRNSTAHDGGALSSFSNTRISHSRFVGNQAARGGAAALMGYDEDYFLDNCLFAGNTASTIGGAIYSSGKDSFTNLTLTSNHATNLGGGIFVGPGQYGNGPSTLILSNSILWQNTSASGNGAQLTLYNTIGVLHVAFCDVQGGQTGVYVQGGTFSWGAGNLAVDPQFVDPPGANFRLGIGSPAIDAASNALVPRDRTDIDGDGNMTELVPWDLDLAPRFIEILGVPNTGSGTPPIVDMGAYERQG